MAPGERVVTGRIVFADAARALGSVVHVLVEEVTRADAASTVAARLDLPVGATLPADRALPFAVPVPDVDPAKRYAVRIHVDRSGDGRIASGDQISTQSHPVLTQGSPGHADVALTLVD